MKLGTCQLLMGVLFSTIALQAQPTTTTLTAVPRIVRVNSSYHPANGAAPAAVESATLSIYAAETGGTALWQETQNVSVDSDGHYSVLLGATRTEGFPQDLFASGEPRWLGVSFQGPGESEQPRVRLASVPYALKAVDAETLGGRPPSDYLLSPSAAATNSAATATSTASTVANGNIRPAKPAPRIVSAGGIPMFTDAAGDLGNSVMTQAGNKIGLGTPSPADFFHVTFNDTSGGFTGYAVQNLGNSGAPFSGMLFYDQNGLLGQFQGFNNLTHEYRINNIATSPTGSINFMLGSSSKFLVRQDGNIDIPGNIFRSGTLFISATGGSAAMTAVGLNTLSSPGGSTRNTAFGQGVLNGAMTSAGKSNSGFGVLALNSVTSGTDNSAFGDSALSADTTGNGNSAFGFGALESNALASNNTAVGTASMSLGVVTGGANTAVGHASLEHNTDGTNNTAIGESALSANTTGSANTAVGQLAMQSNLAATQNVGIGAAALSSLSSGTRNIGIGVSAGSALISGSNNIYLGSSALTTSDNNVMILGNGTTASTVIAGIFGATVIGGSGVLVNSAGQMGVVTSSRRFKQDIQDMGDHSRDLMKLRPVVFHYKVAPNEPLEYGLIAEEVDEVYPDLVVRNKDGQIQTVQYHKLSPMLLNEVQRQQRTIQEQSDQIQQQKEELRVLADRLATIEGRLSSLGLQ